MMTSEGTTPRARRMWFLLNMERMFPISEYPASRWRLINIERFKEKEQVWAWR